MAGVKDLTAMILQDAREKADAILAEANEKAREVEDAATEKAKKASKEAAVKAKKDADDYAARVRSQIGMQQRQRTLKVKQDIIEKVIDQATEALKNQDDASYFDLISTLIAKNAHKENGEILFSAKDLARLTPETEAKIQESAGKAGGSLVISKEAAPIEDGFVLKYGGIEENCTFKALLSEKQELLRDTIQQVLWPKA